VLTLADLRQYLADLHDRWAGDPEDGHSQADRISRRVLELTAEGHPGHASPATTAIYADWDRAGAAAAVEALPVPGRLRAVV